MNPILTLLHRELAGFFEHLTGYVILALAMWVIGLSYLAVALSINGQAVDVPLTEAVYSTPFFWLVILLATPAITMRSYAHERSTGTWETLMTAPVASWEIVLAKFFGAWIFFMILWLPFVAYLFAFRPYFEDPALLDLRILASTIFGVSLLGGLYVAIGCLASALTKSQMLSAMLAFALGMTLFLQSFISFQLPEGMPIWGAIFTHTSMFLHLEDFVRGIVDSRHVVFYLTLIILFLYLNWQIIEARRWL